MASAEVVKLPKDRKGRTLHLPYEVLLGRDAQGEAVSITLALIDPLAWYMGPYMWLYGTGCGGLRQDGTERIGEATDGTD